MTDQIHQDLPLNRTGCLKAIARLSWMFLGNIVLFCLAVFILRRQGYSALDLAYWMAIAVMITIRYIDITRLQGRTIHGEPATLAHWRRYAIFFFLGGKGVWILAHVLSMRS